MGVRDLGLERGRSPLWISNHPRFHGSAWKVTALDIEPSTISRFSVEGHRSEYRTIHDFTVQRGRSPLWKPSQSGRSEPTAELAQPALSSRRAYIPAALTPGRPSTHLVTRYISIQDNNFGMKSSVFGGGTVHDMRLKSEGLYIPRRGNACQMTIS